MSGQPSFSRPGAVDLSSFAPPADRPAGPGPGGAPRAPGGAPGAPGSPVGGAPGGGAPSGGAAGQFVIDVDEAGFQRDVVERSLSVPVVIDFWADWCEPCKQLSPILERLSDEYAGRFVLAKIDIEANQRIAQAAGVQSIPLVMAVLGGQVVPLFQGAVPEEQVRQAIDQLLQVAVANGIAGTSQPVSEGVPADGEGGAPARDPRYADADDALERGDLEGAIQAYRKVLDQTPADAEAKLGLARATLLSRVGALDPTQVRRDAAAKPDDLALQLQVADLDVADGHVADAFDRLVQVVRRTAGDERDAARVHLLDLFEAVGSQDPRVGAARRALSSALF